jgi:hypothetical protein
MIAGAARDGSTTSVPLRRIIPVVVAVVGGRLSKKSARARDSPAIHPYMVPRTTKIHALVTFGVGHRTELLVISELPAKTTLIVRVESEAVRSS